MHAFAVAQVAMGWASPQVMTAATAASAAMPALCLVDTPGGTVGLLEPDNQHTARPPDSPHTWHTHTHTQAVGSRHTCPNAQQCVTIPNKGGSQRHFLLSIQWTYLTWGGRAASCLSRACVMMAWQHLLPPWLLTHLIFFLNWRTGGVFFVLRWIWNCLLHGLEMTLTSSKVLCLTLLSRLWWHSVASTDQPCRGRCDIELPCTICAARGQGTKWRRDVRCSTSVHDLVRNVIVCLQKTKAWWMSGPLAVVHRGKSEPFFAACDQLGNEDMR